jgi:hypothetical protein
MRYRTDRLDFLERGQHEREEPRSAAPSLVTVYSSQMYAAFFAVKNDIFYYEHWYFFEETVTPQMAEFQQ